MKFMYCLASILLLLPPARVGATEDSSKVVPWYDGIELHSFLSGGYEYNFNKPDNQKNQFRVFDFDDNTLKVDVLELVVKKEPVDGSAGFRVDLTAGSSIPQIARAGGLNSGDLDFHQMIASAVIPIGSGLRLDAGKFITPLGYEVIEGYDAFGDNYSRSLLFGYAIPFTHTGVKATYNVSSPLLASLWICNGWDLSIDKNRAKSVGLQLAASPFPGFSVGFTGLAGPEKPSNNSDYRKIGDLTCSYAISPTITLGLNADAGADEHSASGNGSAVWNGIAAYGKLSVCEHYSFAVRAEMFNDPDGFRTGVAQKLTEITITPEYRFTGSMAFRVDFRIDHSDNDVFYKAGMSSNSQSTIGLNLIYWH